MSLQQARGLGFRRRQEIGRGHFAFPGGLESLENRHRLGLEPFRCLVVNRFFSFLEILDRHGFVAAGAGVEVESNSERLARRAELRGRFVRCLDPREQRGRLLGNLPKGRVQEVQGRFDSRLERQEAHRFGENPDPVAKAGVVGDVPPFLAERIPTALRAAAVEIAIIKELEMFLIGKPLFHSHHQVVARIFENALFCVGVCRRRIGMVVTVARAVGGVKVENDVGVPFLVHIRQDSLHFG